jgi:HAE1 family hydrophobic/amphiphilic exporter-1
MTAASFIAIFLIPVTFYVVEKLGHRGTTAALAPAGGAAQSEGSGEKEEDHHA